MRRQQCHKRTKRSMSSCERVSAHRGPCPRARGDLRRTPSFAPSRGTSGLFLTFNRNKKSVVINLKTQAGRAIFYDLVKVCDVVVDNFRPGVLERLEIDYPTLSALNPRLIQCSVTGFGSNGEYPT